MMDDIAEQQDVAKEISEAISNPGNIKKHTLANSNILGKSYYFHGP